MAEIVDLNASISIFEYNNYMRKILSILLFCLSFQGISQVNIDSLLNIWKDSKQPDTARMEALSTLSFEGYIYSNPDSSFYFAQELYNYAIKTGNKKYQAQALNTQGTTFYFKSDYAKAIDYFTKSLKIREEIGDKSGEASCINNMGAIYTDQKQDVKALDCFQRSLKIREAIGDKDGMAASYNNLGSIYSQKKEQGLAIEYYLRSLKIREELGDKVGIGTAYNNIGTVYVDLKDVKKAREYFNKGLKIREQVGDKRGEAMSWYNIARTFDTEGDLETAILTYEKGLKIAKQSEAVLHINHLSLGLYNCYKKVGRYKESLAMYELHIQMRDSIKSESSQKEIMQQEMQYTYEKKKALAEKEREKELAIADEQKKKQKIILYATVVGLLLVIIFSFIIFNRLRVTRKQKSIIAEKQKEILDSIQYAKRIQQSLLPHESYIDKNLKRLLKNKKS